MASDLGATLRQARETAGLSLSGMARRAGFSRSYLGNVETGARSATPAVIKAYERVLGDDVDRRRLLIGMAGAAIAGTVPDVAADVVRDICSERSRLLSTVQTSHDTDRVIGSLIAKDRPALGSLLKWMRSGSPVLRVNAAGILAKVGSPEIDNDVLRVLKADAESRDLYMRAVVSRVLDMPWEDAGRLTGSGLPFNQPDQVRAFVREAGNRYDSGARWCSVLVLARTYSADADVVRTGLGEALRDETSRENLRAMAGMLAGLDPLDV
jgi:transcriptional regulator with XRE-family HTH domain